MNNDKKIQFKIATPERIVFQEMADQVTIPTQEGEITLLPNHIPLITNLMPGVIDVKVSGELVEMAVSGGFMEIHDNEMTVLADTAERAEEIDIERAESARRLAEDRKSKVRKGMDENQYAAVVSQIEKQLARIKVAGRYQRRGKSRMNLGGK